MVRIGRLAPLTKNALQWSNFYLRKIKKMAFYIELYGLQRSIPVFFFMKNIFNHNYFLYLYIIKIFLKKIQKSGNSTVRFRQVFAEPNTIYFIALRCIMNA